MERKAYRDKQGGPRFTVKEPDTEEEIIEEEPKKNEEFYNVCNETKKEKPKKKVLISCQLSSSVLNTAFENRRKKI